VDTAGDESQPNLGVSDGPGQGDAEPVEAAAVPVNPGTAPEIGTQPAETSASGDPDLDDSEAQDDADLYEVLIDPLAWGEHYEAAGRRIKRSARSVRRKMSDPKFARRVTERRAEMVSAGVGRLNQAVEYATEVIINALDTPNVGDRLRAARLILESGSRLTTRVEYERLIDELKRRLAQDQPEPGPRGAT
jgi:hypothetical protein